MTSIPSLTPKEVIKIINKIGFYFVRQKGSHSIYVKEPLMVIVPMHSKSLKKGTLNKIIKDTGLTVEEFLIYQ
jgi:predicted RNA binding protein YcfA (HicA-like mRNA interferase family)